MVKEKIYSINVITAIIEYEVKAFKKAVDEACDLRKTKLEELKKNYVPNTKLFFEQKEAIDNEFSNTMKALRNNAAERVLPEIEGLKAQEKERLMTFNKEDYEKLLLIKDMPLTANELSILAENTLANEDYFTGRLVNYIAEKNNIVINPIYQEVSIDTKFDILDELTLHFNEVITRYPSKDRYESAIINHMYGTDREMKNAKAKYGGQIANIDPEEVARTAYFDIISKNTEIERALFLDNALRNAKGESRNHLLCKLANDASKINDSIIGLSKHQAEIQSFRTGKATEYNKAWETLKRIRGSQDDDYIATEVLNNANNSFMRSLLEKEALKNERMDKFVELLRNEIGSEKE